MKKILCFLLSICFAFVFFGCSLEEISYLYSDRAEIDGLKIGINKTANCCYAGYYTCTEYTENLEITIPDEYDGIPVKRLGGYYGRGLANPFSISLADLYMNAPENSKYSRIFSGNPDKDEISEPYTTENVVFTLNIGKNLEVIDFVDMDDYYPHINDDGSIVFYHPIVFVNCSEENEFFYSKDGKLYHKKTDELIAVWDYAAS